MVKTNDYNSDNIDKYLSQIHHQIYCQANTQNFLFSGVIVLAILSMCIGVSALVSFNILLISVCGVLLLITVIALSFGIGTYMAGAGQKECLQTIAPALHINDKRLIGPLVRLLRECSSWKMTEVKSTLIRLLDQVTQDDLGLLTTEEQAHLWYVAIANKNKHWRLDIPFATSSVRVLLIIGNDEHLKKMQRLVRQTATGKERKYIVDFIQQNLPVMESRLRRQNMLDTLVRPSLAAPPDMLLRSASGTSMSTPEEQKQLLRPDQTPAADPAFIHTDPSALPLTGQSASPEQVQTLGTNGGQDGTPV